MIFLFIDALNSGIECVTTRENAWTKLKSQNERFL
jgi:hypothetical protein